MIRTLFAALALALSATSALADQYADCNKGRDVHRHFSDRSTIKRAIRSCTQIINRGNQESKRSRSTAHSNRGFAFWQLRPSYASRAFADFNAAIKLDPNNADAYIGLANYNLDRSNRVQEFIGRAHGDRDRAFAQFDKAIAINPKSTRAYTACARAYLGTGQTDRAFADYTKVITLTPNDPSAYKNRGDAYNRKGDFDHAIADYTKIIALTPNDLSAYKNRGDAYNKNGDFDRAIADYTKIIALAPIRSANEVRGKAYAKKGYVVKAISDSFKAEKIKLARKHNWGERELSEWRKYFQFELNRIIAHLTKVIARNPNDALAYENRGDAYSMTGEHAKAKADFVKAEELKR